MLTQAIGVCEDAVPVRDKLFTDYFELVKIIAFKKAQTLPAHMDVDDLISAGTIGFLDAIEKFNVSKGASFKAYASIRILGAIKDELRRMDWMSRTMRKGSNQLKKVYEKIEMITGGPADDEEVARSLKKTIGELHILISRVGVFSHVNLEDLNLGYNHEGDILDSIKDPNAEDPADISRIREFKARLVKLLQALPKKKRLVITLYYYEGLTLKEIGEVLGNSEGRICQLLKEVLDKLRVRLRGYSYI
jgi:RNA polymerase sigma factor for flagellar operon FliA